MSEPNKKGLGRGLSALFGDQKNNEKDTSYIKNVALIGDLERNQYQPRIIFNEEKLDELSNSIKKNGLIQPIAVRRKVSVAGKYEIIAGERRWIAAQRAGLHEVPIIVLNLNNSQALEVAIVENIQREDLNAIEEARGYERLMNEFRYDQDKIAKLMAKSRSHISNTLRLLSLPKDVVSLIEEGYLTAGQARPLIGLSDPSSIAEQIVSKKMSARAVELYAKSKKNPKSHHVDSNILEKEKELEQSLGLKASINNKKNNSGKISIEYKNIEQFDLIFNLLKKN